MCQKGMIWQRSSVHTGTTLYYTYICRHRGPAQGQDRCSHGGAIVYYSRYLPNMLPCAQGSYPLASWDMCGTARTHKHIELFTVHVPVILGAFIQILNMSMGVRSQIWTLLHVYKTALQIIIIRLQDAPSLSPPSPSWELQPKTKHIMAQFCIIANLGMYSIDECYFCQTAFSLFAFLQR